MKGVAYALGIDPGIDESGVALVQRDARGGLHVLTVETVRTKRTMSDAERLHWMGAGVQAVILRLCLGTEFALDVVLEVPTHTGRSRKAKAAGGENVFAADMSKFWQALGAIRAVVFPLCDPRIRLVERSPGSLPKLQRQALFSRWTELGKNADERDAIVVACAFLSEQESVADVARRTARR